MREYFRVSRRAFPDQRNELISLRRADGAVVVELWLLGTHLGALAPTGRAFVCERVYFDPSSILKQLT